VLLGAGSNQTFIWNFIKLTMAAPSSARAVLPVRAPVIGLNNVSLMVAGVRLNLGQSLTAFATHAAQPLTPMAVSTSVLAQRIDARGSLRDQAVCAHVQVAGVTHSLDFGDFGALEYCSLRQRLDLIRAPIDPEYLHEMVLGPGLLYALAERQIFALHACALRLGPAPTDPLVAIIARSGVGKSTIAQAARTLGWLRLADDVLPISAPAPGNIEARPHFPQLKLPAEQQYPPNAPPALELAGVLLMSRADKLLIEILPPRAVADMVLRNTVASRLFPTDWLTHHLKFAANLAGAVNQGLLRAGKLQLADDTEAPLTAACAALLQLREQWM